MIKKTAKNLTLLLFSILIFFALLEIGLRIMNYPTTQHYKVRHPVTRWFHVPNKDFDIELPVENPEFIPHVKTNFIGMQDIDYPMEKPGNTIRGVVLGDSFCAALEVSQKQNFHTILEDYMAVEGKRVEFLNFGIRGIGLAEQIQIFNTMGAQFNPDFVLLSVFLGNDLNDIRVFYNEGYPDPLVENSHLNVPLNRCLKYLRKKINFALKEYTKTYPFLYYKFSIIEDRFNSWLDGTTRSDKKKQESTPIPISNKQVVKKVEKNRPLLIKNALEAMEAPSPGQWDNIFSGSPASKEEKDYVDNFMNKYHEALEKEKGVPDTDKPAYHAKFAEKEPLVMELMLIRKLHDILKARKIKLYLFYFDEKFHLIDNTSEDKEKKIFWILKRFFSERNIPHYNLMAALATRPEHNFDTLYNKSDYHWNPMGHLFVAKGLKVFLEPLLEKDFWQDIEKQ